MFGITARNMPKTCAGHRYSSLPFAIRLYTTERHTTLSAKAWVLTNGDPIDTLKMTRLATALGIPFETKHAIQASTWLSEVIRRPFKSIRSLLSKPKSPGALQHIQDATASDLPRIAIAASEEAVPGLLEAKLLSCGQTMTVYLGLPKAKLSKIDALVLSQLDQMKLRTLGPGRAILDNAESTLLPFSGGLATMDAHDDASVSPDAPRTLAVCIGQGMEPAGFRLLTRDVDALAEGLMRIPSHPRIRVLLPRTMHKGIRRMVNSHLICKLLATHTDPHASQHPPSNIEVLDYSLGAQLPSPVDVISAATHVITTADNVSMMSLAVSLRRPVYIAGEERTTDVLRSYYHTLETKNLVRRFYPTGSKYDYMLMADIDGKVDDLSAIRDHDPWAKYDAEADLYAIAWFIQLRYSQIKQ
ncbi:hypothetical protein IW140_002039 [Coemansia sp. RSA 1813]|nr:hypothetical protein EV178_000350 [Coemansia sp. RSA 1646]KAJ1773540.1 hypothetical protein LPJ74_000455 [Coemansia sp. RSA 1843]KAJ2090548.1 hypothetical protein IW138_002555 [Coemansia sp. RSA 986]KAJ2216364.1 hypothetical protein EV179_001390 [Coemansia sp. RSA 487]KAJ2570851.1 hypothetical protein IW140_002039 [Coemansia sp. RSA 1813]